MNISEKLNQKAVYWGTPVPDGRGGWTFATEVEVSCRWEEKSVKFINPDGEEKVSKAVVMVDRTIVVGGYLYLGTQASLPVSHSDPTAVPGAWQIKQFSPVPTLDAREYVRNAYL